jgi:hypothetical protein
MFEGQANLGVAPIQPDGSWAAKIPADIPVHLQAVDVFGMSLFNEPVWFSARPGESRICGGCHEDRTRTTTVKPGVVDAAVAANNELFSKVARSARLNTNPMSATQIVGVGWNTQVQPIFDANCVTGCHDANNSAGVAGYTITDPATGTSVSWTLNLTGAALPASLAVAVEGSFTASYFSMIGPDPEAVERNHLMISGNFKAYLNPEDAHGSIAIQKLNPTRLFPTPDPSVRAFATPAHLTALGKTDLTPQEFYTLILVTEMGGSFYARENKPPQM